MTNNTLENRIEQLVNREIYLNQSHLVEDLILKPNPDWIVHIDNYYDESSEAIKDFLTYETNIEEEYISELDVFERHNLTIKHGFESSPQEIFEWWLI